MILLKDLIREKVEGGVYIKHKGDEYGNTHEQ